ncbi:hypothetical protein FOZ60_015422 [Perkinsus olseni]|uniref:Uncharacterized protein n=1 Tax=Perkinsus olseni TaxID=32597 RepID=A0A7J6N5D7_PEROL|nr:hypothetical protein FOZ60_015422 [Perkinsus olseni]
MEGRLDEATERCATMECELSQLRQEKAADDRTKTPSPPIDAVERERLEGVVGREPFLCSPRQSRLSNTEEIERLRIVWEDPTEKAKRHRMVQIADIDAEGTNTAHRWCISLVLREGSSRVALDLVLPNRNAFEVWVLGINELCEYSSRLKSLTRETFMLYKALSEDAGEEAPAGPTSILADPGTGGFSAALIIKSSMRRRMKVSEQMRCWVHALGLLCNQLFTTSPVSGVESRVLVNSFDHAGEQLPGGFMSLPELLKDQIRPLDRRSSASLIKRTLSLDEVDALFDTIAATRREEGQR